MFDSRLIYRLTGEAGFYDYTIPYSARFNDDDTAYTTFTCAAGDRRQWTVAFWLKRANLSLADHPTLYSHNNKEFVRFEADNSITTAVNANAKTYAQVVRDPTDWMHFCWAVDTDQATAANRSRLYINGIENTTSGGADPALNGDSGDFNENGKNMYWGYNVNGGKYLDGYLAECHFIDGTQYAASDFGESKYGIWIPKAFKGTYGTNGSYLDFSNSSDFGEDQSGESNDFTDSNLATNDQVLDTPTNNYPTLNVLHHLSTATLANGNLDCSGAENEYATIIIPSTGKWGWEITVSENGSFGLEDIDANEEVAADVSGEVVEMLVDMVGGTLKKKVDGGGLETIEAALNTSSEWYPYFKAACSVDFGQGDYAPTESGYKTLCSDNITNPTITDSSTGFGIALWTGDASDDRDIGNFGFDLSGGCMLWTKHRGAVTNHEIYDTVRGVTKALHSNDTDTEATQDGNVLQSFDDGSFQVGDTDPGLNDNANTYVAWCFRMGATYGFDIQTYEGTGVAHAENHDLGGVPELMIVKNLDTANSWLVYHHHALNKTDPETDYGLLEGTLAWADASVMWNDTAPTSTQFTIGNHVAVNTNNDSHIAYLWRSIPGFSRVFSYEGNANADGTFVYCGFRPKYVLLKDADDVTHWFMYDTERNTYNPVDNNLQPDDTAGEATVTALDIVSNGFKLRSNSGDYNTTHTYVGVAYAEQPGKYSNAR